MPPSRDDNDGDDAANLLNMYIRATAARDRLFMQALEQQAKAFRDVTALQTKATQQVANEVALLRADVAKFAPSPKLVAAGFAAVLSVGALIIVLLILGAFALRGVDVELLARAAATALKTTNPAN